MKKNEYNDVVYKTPTIRPVFRLIKDWTNKDGHTYRAGKEFYTITDRSHALYGFLTEISRKKYPNSDLPPISYLKFVEYRNFNSLEKKG